MTEFVETLLEYGADVTAQDDAKRNALSYALDEGHTEIVEILRNAGVPELEEVSGDPTVQPAYTFRELAGLAIRLNEVAERMDEVRKPPPVEPEAEGRRDWEIARTLIFQTEEWDTRLEWLATAYYLSALASEENTERAWQFYHMRSRPIFDYIGEQMEWFCRDGVFFDPDGKFYLADSMRLFESRESEAVTATVWEGVDAFCAIGREIRYLLLPVLEEME
jgi:hypothetical protein